MNVSLTPELEAVVTSKVGTGKYASASEVVREGIRLLQQRDELYDTKLASLRNEIRKGLEDIEAGRVFDGEQAMNKTRARLLKKKQGNG